jgi:hypothetical protein
MASTRRHQRGGINAAASTRRHQRGEFSFNKGLVLTGYLRAVKVQIPSSAWNATPGNARDIK